MSKRRKIELRRERVRLAKLGKHKRLKKLDYYERLPELQLKLQLIQQAFLSTGDRGVVVFEGWDASGKGGTIRRMAQLLDPRSFKVYAMAAPPERGRARHYLHRFWDKLPPPGSIAVFDGSWYGRVLTDRVEGLATESEWKRAFDEVNEFERLLLDDGMRLIKIFLHITPDEQLRRFKERLSSPAKRWQLSYEDFRNRGLWDQYEAAVEEMVGRTSTRQAPWTLIAGNDKRFARVECLKVVAERLAKGVELGPRPVDERTRAAALETFGADFDLDGESGD